MLFDNYSEFAYIGQNSGLIDENIKLKQFLTSVELTKFLKDYKNFYLNSRQEVNSMVKEINLRLTDQKTFYKLDLSGFQQYIVHYCLKNLTILHQITTNTTKTIGYASQSIKSEVEKKKKTLEGQLIQVLLQELIKKLKENFVNRKVSVAFFEDVQDIVLLKIKLKKLRLTIASFFAILITFCRRVTKRSLRVLLHTLTYSVLGFLRVRKPTKLPSTHSSCMSAKNNKLLIKTRHQPDKHEMLTKRRKGSNESGYLSVKQS